MRVGGRSGGWWRSGSCGVGGGDWGLRGVLGGFEGGIIMFESKVEGCRWNVVMFFLVGDVIFGCVRGVIVI